MLVKLTYFKQTSGKLYTSGEYETACVHMFEVFQEVAGLREAGMLPGLIKGHSEFVVLVEVPDHPFNHQQLIGIGEHAPRPE